ncbi:TRAP transporter large permease [Amorphus sp. 3PC139-8]|uniref:TRAP transporter large permease n=1 Tax=Amorphus sp. 3PC139-8 TaxID=2735676 RepID=UPI00345CB62D
MSGPLAMTAIGFAGLFALILMRVPIGVAMGISGFVGFGILSGFGPALTLFGTEPAQVLSNANLAVVPLFLLMGSLATVSGLSDDIYRLVYAMIGHWPGGLACATVGGCAGFGAVCGSSPATAATMGQIALPQMLRRGYSPGLATGTIAAGGTLGMLIPPSIVMVIYAFLAREFVIDIFVAALLPALLAVVLQVLAIIVYVRIWPEAAPAGERIAWRERARIVRNSWGVVIMIGSVMGGLYSGIFTVNEAAAVGVLVAFLFAMFRRSLNRRSVIRIVRETASNTAMIYVIIIGASIFTYFVTATRLPGALTQTFGDMDVPPLVIIVAILAMYVALGCVFDTISSMVITLPFVLPVVTGLGYDAIWWGIVLIMVIELGMITPPVGMNVLILHGIDRTIPIGRIFTGIIPFAIADLIRIAIIVLFPALALWLPTIVR